MKILHTIEGMGAKFGGIATCTYDLVKFLNLLNITVDIISPSLKNNSDRLLGDGEKWNIQYKNDGIGPVNYSRNFVKWLDANNYDIYHANGLWQFIVHETCNHARQKGKPYLITPHGMLYPEALARSSWKKRLLEKLWFGRDIREASCIHATCDKEMENLRLLGYKGPIAVIGNPVAVPDYTEGLFSSRRKKASPLWGVAFLGRLHPIKKVENLLYGVSLSSHENVNVYIMGKGDDDYEEFLRNEAKRLSISDRTHFLGFINGKDKFKRLAMMDALFVPSDMENFGMIIPEALIVGTPVMASLGTPWEALNSERCGWWRDNSPESIAAVIDELYSLSDEERHAMGLRGREYILQNFSANKVAQKMNNLYLWLNKEIDKPNFVYEY